MKSTYQPANVFKFRQGFLEILAKHLKKLMFLSKTSLLTEMWLGRVFAKFNMPKLKVSETERIFEKYTFS